MLIKRNKARSDQYEELYTADGRHHATVLSDSSVTQHMHFHEQMGTGSDTILKSKHKVANAVDLDIQLAEIDSDINIDEY